jgi:hypothetical protein
MTWGDAWLMAGLLVAVLETVALLRKEPGDTLSEQVWTLLRVRWVRPIAWAGWLYLTFHFFLQWR